MKLHSVYLNPFQPFPERELDRRDEERPESAIEDNLSRSVFSALANAAHPRVLAKFLQALVQQHGSLALRDRLEDLVKTLLSTDPSEVEFGLQSWPAAAMGRRDSLKIILIGISSSHERAWTHDQRLAPKENPRFDAWIYVPEEMLLVFECKNDEHPLDATQVSAYAHDLGLLTEKDRVPCAQPGLTLTSVEEAQAVQQACKDLVLDAAWSTVGDTLKQIESEESIGSLERWLCGMAASYIQSHIYPPYCGMQTVLEWLKGRDTPDRRNHLRTLVRKVGDTLAGSAQGLQGAITFATDENGERDLATGAGSAVYVKLKRDGRLLQGVWLGKKRVYAVLWFKFTEDDNQQRIGLECYLQASGSHSTGKDEADWNEASMRHMACAKPFEEQVDRWSREAPTGALLLVSTVKFRGSKRTWQGGGVEDPGGPKFAPIKPQDALAFLRKNQTELWRFPRVGLGEECEKFEQAALLVRKPALSLLASLEAGALASCGEDGRALQDLLQKAVASIVPDLRRVEDEETDQAEATP